MIQAEYINDLHNSYLVIKGSREYSNSYEGAMITGNLIPGLIKTELRIYDDIELFYYDITGKKELIKKYHSSFLSYENIVGLLTRIFFALESSYDYLLTEDNIVINPEYIFWDSLTEEISLCYVIGYKKDMKEQLCSLLEYLMNKVDYKDEGAVLLVYTLYKKSKDEDCTYEELKEELQVKHREKAENIKETIKKVGTSVNTDINSNINTSVNIGTNINTNKTINTDTSINRNKAINADTSINGNKTINTSTSTNTNETMITNKFLSSSHDRISNKDKAKSKLAAHLLGKKKYTPLDNEIISEREVYYYPVSIYIKAGIYIGLGIITLLLGFLFRLYDNSLGSAPEPLKILCALVIMGCLQIYILSKLFTHTNKVTRMEKVTEYGEEKVDGVKERDKEFYSPPSISIESPTEILWKSDKEDNHTQVLAVLREKHTLIPKENNENPCIVLKGFPFIIGKEKEKVNAVINAATISRLHCKFEEIENEVYIVDLGSTNGTYINEKRIEKLKPHKVIHKDMISLSNINYEYEKSEESI